MSKSDKVLQQQNKTNNKRPFSLPKMNKVFPGSILQNLNGRSVLDKFFFENDCLDELKKMLSRKKFYLFSIMVKIPK